MRFLSRTNSKVSEVEPLGDRDHVSLSRRRSSTPRPEGNYFQFLSFFKKLKKRASSPNRKIKSEKNGRLFRKRKSWTWGVCVSIHLRSGWIVTQARCQRDDFLCKVRGGDSHRPRLDCLIWFSSFSLSPFATIPPLLLLCVVFLCVSPFPKLADRISLSFYALSFRGRVPSASRSNIVNVSQLRPFEKYIARTRCRHKDERFFPKAPETIWDFLFSSRGRALIII